MNLLCGPLVSTSAFLKPKTHLIQSFRFPKPSQAGLMPPLSSYLIVAWTVITEVPDAFGPLPVALIAKVSVPLYLALVLYS